MAVLELVEQIKPLFAGKGPELQGAVIVELMSLWLAGHPKDVRADLLEINNVAIPCLDRSQRSNARDRTVKLFKIGDILRYDWGETALMRVTYVSRNHGGSPARYYGQQCMGGSCGAYHENVSLASAADRKTWFECGREYKRRPWRQVRKEDRGIVGAVEDS